MNAAAAGSVSGATGRNSGGIAVRPKRFSPENSPIGPATFTEGQPEPEFIIDGILPNDTGVISAPGGSSKSTLMLWVACHIILGRSFLGRRILRPGRVLIVSAEDPIRRIRCRAHQLGEAMALSPQDQQKVGAGLMVEDVTGALCRLAGLDKAGNLQPTTIVDELIDAYGDVKLSLLVLDPYVYFQPGERFVNDADSVMAQIAARLSRELDCAVIYVAHSGKAQARSKTTDQYASRGGSALPDGMRFVMVLTVVGSKDHGTPGWVDAADVGASRILRLDIPKITDAAPITEPVWLRRRGFDFEWLPPTVINPGEVVDRAVGRIAAFIAGQLEIGIRHSRNTLEACKALGFSRTELRGALDAALEAGVVVLKELPPGERHGGRTQYYDVVARS